MLSGEVGMCWGRLGYGAGSDAFCVRSKRAHPWRARWRPSCRRGRARSGGGSWQGLHVRASWRPRGSGGRAGGRGCRPCAGGRESGCRREAPKICHIKQLPVVSQGVSVARPSVTRAYRRGGTSGRLRGALLERPTRLPRHCVILLLGPIHPPSGKKILVAPPFTKN
jgi:hypothetical protein